MNIKECGMASRPPKTVTECYAVSRLSLKMLEFGNIIEKYGKILCYIVIGIGIINSIISAGLIEAISYESEVMMETGFIMCIITLFTWSMYAFATYFAYKLLSMLIIAIGAIVQNTYVLANVNLYEAFSKGTTEESETKAYNPNKSVDASSAWKCEKCGANNDAGVQMCKSCGHYK